jgi:hypothetical protein
VKTLIILRERNIIRVRLAPFSFSFLGKSQFIGQLEGALSSCRKRLTGLRETMSDIQLGFDRLKNEVF